MKNVYIVVLTLFFFSCKDVRKEYYSDGSLEREIEYKGEIQDGMIISYYPNGVIKDKYYAIDMNPNGEGKVFYENGQLKTVVNFVDGVQHGILNEYFKDGKIKSEQMYKEGVPNGVFNFYYSNGKLKENALVNNDTTIYFVKYDSLGNWLEEYRECNVDIPKNELCLGEDYVIKFNIAGPIMEQDSLQLIMIAYQPGGEQYPHTYFIDMKKPIFKFTPTNKGEWIVSGGILLIRDEKVVWDYNQKSYTFNVIEKER